MVVTELIKALPYLAIEANFGICGPIAATASLPARQMLPVSVPTVPSLSFSPLGLVMTSKISKLLRRYRRFCALICRV